jgi:enoyl-CoA hydratase
MTDRKDVSVEIDGEIGTIILDRPERRNALSIAIKRDIEAAIDRLSADDSVRIILITGAGEYFVAGTDIAEMVDMTPADHLALRSDGMFKALRRCEKIMIAAVEGYALGGGCELALCCDLIIVGETAQFGQPEIRVGIMPGAGGTQGFVRAMGRHRAMKLLLTGEPLTARDAFAMGIVSDVVPAGSARQEAVKLANKILAMPPLGVAGIRSLVRQGPDMPIDTALELERKTFVLLFDSADQKEGMRAFLEKRKPVYSGR